MHNRTLKNIYVGKIYDVLEEKDLFFPIKVIVLSCIASSIIFATTYTEIFIEHLWQVLLFENMILIKTITIFYLVFNYKTIFEIKNQLKKDLVKKIKRVSIQVAQKDISQDEKICGIDIEKILEHLFEEKSFKVHDIQKKFGIPMNQYNDLAKKLDSSKITIRGFNNSRVLNEEYSKEQIMKAFVFADGDIEKIQIHCERVEGTSHFSRTPLARI